MEQKKIPGDRRETYFTFSLDKKKKEITIAKERERNTREWRDFDSLGWRKLRKPLSIASYRRGDRETLVGVKLERRRLIRGWVNDSRCIGGGGCCWRASGRKFCPNILYRGMAQWTGQWPQWSKKIPLDLSTRKGEASFCQPGKIQQPRLTFFHESRTYASTCIAFEPIPVWRSIWKLRGFRFQKTKWKSF